MIGETGDFGGDCRVFVDQRRLAIDLLRAVADGNEDASVASAGALADAVLAAPSVRLALSVREGGVLAITRAVRLAERVLRATRDDEAPRAVRQRGQK